MQIVVCIRRTNLGGKKKPECELKLGIFGSVNFWTFVYPICSLACASASKIPDLLVKWEFSDLHICTFFQFVLSECTKGSGRWADLEVNSCPLYLPLLPMLVFTLADNLFVLNLKNGERNVKKKRLMIQDVEMKVSNFCFYETGHNSTEAIIGLQLFLWFSKQGIIFNDPFLKSSIVIIMGTYALLLLFILLINRK